MKTIVPYIKFCEIDSHQCPLEKIASSIHDSKRFNADRYVVLIEGKPYIALGSMWSSFESSCFNCYEVILQGSENPTKKKYSYQGVRVMFRDQKCYLGDKTEISPMLPPSALGLSTSEVQNWLTNNNRRGYWFSQCKILSVYQHKGLIFADYEDNQSGSHHSEVFYRDISGDITGYRIKDHEAIAALIPEIAGGQAPEIQMGLF